MAGGTPIGVPLKLVLLPSPLPSSLSASGSPLTPGCWQDPKAGPNATSADLQIDWEDLEARFSPKTKILVLNNPHNPTGKVAAPLLWAPDFSQPCPCLQLFTAEELTRLAALATKHNVIVIADEVYEWLVYKPGKMIRFGIHLLPSCVITNRDPNLYSLPPGHVGANDHGGECGEDVFRHGMEGSIFLSPGHPTCGIKVMIILSLAGRWAPNASFNSWSLPTRTASTPVPPPFRLHPCLSRETRRVICMQLAPIWGC